MTAILALALAASSFYIGWLACVRHHGATSALRLDRDLHEQDSHVRGDAADRAWRHVRWLIDHPAAAARAHRIATGHPRARRRTWRPGWGQS